MMSAMLRTLKVRNARALTPRLTTGTRTLSTPGIAEQERTLHLNWRSLLSLMLIEIN
jgi:hypothetical protein